MITPKTQAAIAVLNHIYAGEEDLCPDRYGLAEEERRVLLSQLTDAGLITPTDRGNPKKEPSYIPARKAGEVSLLDILEATGEHLNCNHSTTEKFYMRYGKAAQKLGVVNQMTRTYLKEIKLYDL